MRTGGSVNLGGRSRSAALGLVVWSGLAGGCSSAPEGQGKVPAASALAARDFRAPPAAPDSSATPAEAPAKVTPATPAPSAASLAARPEPRVEPTAAGDAPPRAPRPISDAVAMPGAPRLGTLGAAKPAGRAEVVEAVVGQINGKPVYVSDVMGRLGARLDRMAKEAKSRDAWVRSSATLIIDDLRKQLYDELLLAEARSGLTPEQRRGLLQFLSNIQQNIAATAGGSKAQADERLLLEEGKSLEALAQEERDKTLIRVLVNRYITPRVNVSWRDVEKEYARLYDQYNPPGVAKLRVVQAPTSNEARVKALGDAVASGRSLEDIAKDRTLNDFNAGGAGMVEAEVKDTLAEAQLLADPALNDAARSLSVGQTVGPVKGRTVTAYLRLEAIDRPPGVPLEDAQLELAALLHDKRFRAEYERFVKRLVEKGSASDLTEMTTKLVQIADDRYYRPLAGRAPAPTPAPTPR